MTISKAILNSDSEPSQALESSSYIRGSQFGPGLSESPWNSDGSGVHCLVSSWSFDDSALQRQEYDLDSCRVADS